MQNDCIAFCSYLQQPLRRQLLFFIVAGTVGFIIDASVLYTMVALGFNPYVGRLISFLMAVGVTWQINRKKTFISKIDISKWYEFSQYLFAMSWGGLVNYAIYAIVISFSNKEQLSLFYALALSSIMSMGFNFLAAKYWVFKK